MINSVSSSDLELHRVTEEELNEDVQKVKTECTIEQMAKTLEAMSDKMVFLSNRINKLTEDKENANVKIKKLTEECSRMLVIKKTEKEESLKKCREKYSVLCTKIQDDPALWLIQRLVKLMINNRNKNSAIKHVENKYKYVDRKVDTWE